jgi:hypothetical protein
VGPDPKGRWAGEVQVAAEVEAAPDTEVGRLELWVDGRFAAEAAGPGPVAFDTRTVADGPHEVRLVAVEAGPIATRSFVAQTVEVRNGTATITPSRPKPAALGTPVALSGRAKGVERVTLRRGREVLAEADVKSGRWKVEIDSARLGVGTVTLRVEGSAAEGPGVVARIDVVVRERR